MALTNTARRYGGVTKMFHWLTAALILTLIPLGWYANQQPFDTDVELARKAWLFSLHKTLGVTTFFVALARIVWALIQPRPGALHADRQVERFLSDVAHWLLYGALVIVPLSGWIAHAAAAGFAPIWWPFGQGLPLVPENTAVEHFFGALHWVAGRVLLGTLALHIAGALKHVIIDRDATLRRMLPGDVALGPLPDQRQNRLAPIIAALLWGAAVGLAATLSTGSADEVTTPDLAEVISNWDVQEGMIEITVTQFGSEITGSFADWTAEIAFEDSSTEGPLGQVTAIISVPSLSLGSVTSQALAADFLDASNFAAAVFTGDITRIVDGFAATGSLTIKDQPMPLTLPFSLSLQGDLAMMHADLTLDRRAFGIGQNVKDQATLAYDVGITISLTARRIDPF